MRTEAFERLYAAHANSLLGFLVYRTGDRALAEDILADTFEKVLHSRRPFDPRRASEKTWLYTIALNTLRDHRRRSAASHRALARVRADGSDTPRADQLEAVEERDMLQRGLARLTREEREAVALRYGADLTVAEIAKVTGEKPSTIHGRVYRSLEKLREQLM